MRPTACDYNNGGGRSFDSAPIFFRRLLRIIIGQFTRCADTGTGRSRATLAIIAGIGIWASAVTPVQAQTAAVTPLYFTDHDGADCSRDSLFIDYKDGRTGGLSSDLHADVFASRAIARSGNCAIGIRMTGLSQPRHPRAGAFVFMSNLQYPRNNQPAVPMPNGYYSAWYYLPEDYRAEHMWNVFQFMNRLARADVAGDPIERYIDGSGTVERMFSSHIRVQGQPELVVQHVDYLTNPRQRASNDGLDRNTAEAISCFRADNNCYSTPDQGGVSAAFRFIEPMTAVTIPAGRWFQIQAKIVKSTNSQDNRKVNPDGSFIMWLDGQKIIHENNIQTRLHPRGTLHWEINSYNNYGTMSHDTVDLYLDDTEIRGIDNDLSDETAKSGPKDCTIGTPVLYQEAEHGSINDRMRVIEKSGASGGRVLAALSDGGGSAQYCLRTVSAGRYQLRGIPAEGQFRVSIDGKPVDGDIQLSAGIHQLSIEHTSGAAHVDRVGVRASGGDKPGGETRTLFDFENGEKWANFRHPGNLAATRLINTTDDNDAITGKALEMQLDADQPGIAMSFSNSLAYRNWSGFKSLVFDARFSGSGQKYVVKIREDVENFEHTLIDDVRGWHKVTIPLSSFTRARWQPSGAPDDGMNLTNVERLMVLSTSGNTVLTIDNVGISTGSSDVGFGKVLLR